MCCYARAAGDMSAPACVTRAEEDGDMRERGEERDTSYAVARMPSAIQRMCYSSARRRLLFRHAPPAAIRAPKMSVTPRRQRERIKRARVTPLYAAPHDTP